MSRASAASFITVVALGLFVVPAEAGMISGEFEGDGVRTPGGQPDVFVQNFTGEGDDTTLGHFTIQSQSMIDFSDPPTLVISNGMITLSFDDGTLFGTSSGMGTASGQGTATFEVDLVFTGGTGFFAGTTGEATITGTITRTGPTTDSVDASYTGSLSVVPEPNSLTLFALGASSGMAVLVRAGRKSRGLKVKC